MFIKHCFLLVLLTTGTFFSSSQASGFAMIESKPLSQSINQSETIVVVRLISYVGSSANKVQLAQGKDSKGQTYTFFAGPDALIAATAIKQPGHYMCQTVYTVKGQAASSISLDLPYVSSFYYGGARFAVKEKSLFLLLLRRNNSGQLVPVDSTLPIIPLSSNLPALNSIDTPHQRVIKLMLSSFSDSAARQANSYLLRKIVDSLIVLGLAPYINDTNPYVRDNAVYSMIVNQQVAAIPLVGSNTANGSGEGAIGALSSLVAPEAVPYLNPLLFDPDQYVRLNAIGAIGSFSYKAYTARKAFDRRSIPYLLLALRDPELQRVTAQSAYGILHQMNPEPGLAKGDSYFYTNREAETKKLLDWWRDELSGKHPRELMPGESAPVAKKLPDNLDTMTKAAAVAALNPLLFEMSDYTRRRTIRELKTRADSSSIPYLLLGCEDPDFEIAYTAYTTLHRLLPSTGATVTNTAFTADRDAATKPLYIWWQSELLGKHLLPDTRPDVAPKQTLSAAPRG